MQPEYGTEGAIRHAGGRSVDDTPAITHDQPSARGRGSPPTRSAGGRHASANAVQSARSRLPPCNPEKAGPAAARVQQPTLRMHINAPRRALVSGLLTGGPNVRRALAHALCAPPPPGIQSCLGRPDMPLCAF